MGAGGAPPAGETPAAQAAAQRPVFPTETPAAEEARESKKKPISLVAEVVFG